MKILLITHGFHPDIGGIEVNSEILAYEFTKAGHEVEVITWSEHTHPDTFPFLVLRNPNRRQLLSAHRWADVVFENNVCLRLAWPALMTRKPRVVALRTWVARTDGRRAWQDRLKLLWLKHAQAVIAVSAAVRDKCFPQATVIGNPYREETFFLRDQVKRDQDFVFLGRLVSDKGADMAIEALTKLSKTQGQPITLTIIGEGPERANLEALGKNLGVESQVAFAGRLEGEKLGVELNRHRYLWAPSRWEEPFGNVALEGMACGCIPLVSDGGGFPDAVGDAGLIFKRGDLADLVEKSRILLEDAPLCQRIRNETAEHLDRHRPAAVARQYLDVIERAVRG